MRKQMRVFVAVNRTAEIGFRQTTTLLIAALVRRNCDVWLVDVDQFSAFASELDFQILTHACQVPFDQNCNSELVESFAKSAPIQCQQNVSAGDLILIRTNPGRDLARSSLHESFLHLCEAAQTNGVRIVNAPGKLRYFASKASLVAVAPEFRPPMIVTQSPEQILEFVANSPADCVAKPLFGSRGENVIRFSRNTEQLESILWNTFGESTLVVQQFIHADHPGDQRVVVLGGDVLEIEGHLAGIERHPSSGDFRANLHAGGSAHPLTLNPAARAAAEYAAKLLDENGICLAGVDLIGDKIIEFNVFSTGGLFDSMNFSGIRFDDAIVDRLLAK